MAIACENGYVYIVQDCKIVQQLNCGNVVTTVVACPVTASPHLLFCAGHFNALKVFWKGKVSPNNSRAIRN